jgi:LPXTG-motif cell wall-anchored protein
MKISAARKAFITVGLFLGVGITASAVASSIAEPVWGNGAMVEFPAGVVTNYNAAYVNTVSCSSPGNCTAAGIFELPSNSQQLYTISMTNGVWGSPREAVFPNGVQASYTETNPGKVSCSSAGNCTVVGLYYKAGGGAEAFTMTSTNGTWAQARPVVFANNVAKNPPHSRLVDVSCPSDGNCTAVGWFENPSGGTEQFTMTMTAGTWAQASPVVFPANTQQPTPRAGLTSVSCASASNCTAVGYFTNTNGDWELATTSSNNGIWSQATRAVYPAATRNSVPDEYFNKVSCSSAGNCTAVGWFSTASGTYEALTMTSTNGTWAQAQPVLFPAGTLSGNPFSELNSISCSSAGNCTAIGRYSAAGGGTEAFALSSTNGTWANPVRITFNTGVLNSSPENYSYDVSCVSAGNCTAVGTFRNTAGVEEGFSVSSISGTWGTARPSTVIVSGQSTRRPGSIGSVSCAGALLCTAGGAVKDGSNKNQAFLMSSSEAPPTTTTTTTTTTTSTTISPTTTVSQNASGVAPPSIQVVSLLPVTKTPILETSTVVGGSSVSVSFGGFRPNEFVQLVVASTPQVIATGYANAQGVVTLTGKIPSNLTSGSHTIAVFAPASGRGFKQTITVSSSTLPSTGTNSHLTTMAGFWTILCGCGVLVLVRRRKSIQRLN